MAIYLTELANWLRNAGLNVIEYEGWQTRARGSSGYSDYPLCVMWHHTASPKSWDGQKDADYCTVGDEDAPLANLYIQRSGAVWVCAAGATNTNGSGQAITFSRGTVPENSMNTRAVGVEMGNDGIGEQWPQAQIDAAFLVSNTVNSRLGNQPSDVSTHQFYAPDRKVDPATCNVAGPWKPESCTSSGSWDRASVQAECVRRAESGSASSKPELSDNPMFVAKHPNDADSWSFGDGLWRHDINDEFNDGNAEAVMTTILNDRARAGNHLIDLDTGNQVSNLSDITEAKQWRNRLGKLVPQV